MKPTVQATLNFVRDTFEKSEWLKKNPQEKEYRYHHTLRVVNQAKRIVDAENLDEEIVLIGALLHDISYANEFCSAEEHQEHGRLSARQSKLFLNSLRLTPYQIQQILLGIAIHVDDVAGEFEANRSIEACTIGDADNLDRFDTYRIYENLEYLKFSSRSLAEQLTCIHDKIEAYPQLVEFKKDFSTLTVQRIWQEKIDFQLFFYQQLHQQLQEGVSIERQIMGDYHE